MNFLHHSFFILIHFFIFSVTFSQDVDFVSKLKVIEVEQSFLVNWTIDSGKTCQGQNILHSTDGVNFEEVGHISGICGNLSEPVDYSFTHSNPVPNAINYYRIELGGYGVSQIVSEYLIVVSSNSALVYPSPSQNDFFIKWNNTNNSKLTISFYSQFGRMISKEESSGEMFYGKASDFTAGIYLFEIVLDDSGQKIRGKLIIN